MVKAGVLSGNGRELGSYWGQCAGTPNIDVIKPRVYSAKANALFSDRLSANSMSNSLTEDRD